MIKVIQLSTSDMGGAGIAAKKLHLNLLNNGIESEFVTKVKLGGDIPAHRLVKETKKKNILELALERVSNTIKYRMPFFDNDLNYYVRDRDKRFDYFSFPFSDNNIYQIEAVKNADILHLHWISDGFIDYRNVFSSGSGKKFVWTLHDMNPFTGGCHASDGCMKFENNCNYCFQLAGTPDEYLSNKLLNYKLAALNQLRDDQLTIITPSQFLSDLSKRSKAFSRFKHEVIPNVIVFPQDVLSRDECRDEFNLGRDTVTFLFVSHNVNNVRKGIGVIKEVLPRLVDKNISLITIGEKSGIQIEGIQILELGFVTDKLLMKKAFFAADAFLLPSVSENFPNSIVEALLSGTPVIASNVGGIPEQIDEKNGILALSNSVHDWEMVVNQFINRRSMYNRSEIAREAAKKYEVNQIVQKHIELYKSILG
ncbi:MAG: glycosyl transferase group 1 [Bacteroidota bacterium]|jgi:glycosyltransferase involved in cell wall biosynthesis|nr:glycosyl transferase group 1 [Bacteroidota bacterium]